MLHRQVHYSLVALSVPSVSNRAIIDSGRPSILGTPGLLPHMLEGTTVPLIAALHTHFNAMYVPKLPDQDMVPDNAMQEYVLPLRGMTISRTAGTGQSACIDCATQCSCCKRGHARCTTSTQVQRVKQSIELECRHMSGRAKTQMNKQIQQSTFHVLIPSILHS